MPARYDGPCRKCGGPIVRDSKGERKCPACFAVRKRYERERAALKAGKPYMPGVPYYVASRLSRQLSPPKIAEGTWRRIEEANARQAWRSWLRRAPLWWMDARQALWAEMHPTAGHPTGWYGRRYRNEPEFRAREIKRIAERKAKRGRFAEYVRLVIRGKQRDTRMRCTIGYGRDELIAHLVGNFEPGMTLAALLRGEIHIEHDDPTCRYDTNDDNALMALWAFDNINPMWPDDNYRKGARTLAEWRASGMQSHSHESCGVSA
jgi:hypothetical protein